MNENQDQKPIKSPRQVQKQKSNIRNLNNENNQKIKIIKNFNLPKIENNTDDDEDKNENNLLEKKLNVKSIIRKLTD
jgi:hypothetical protein